jgi:hypothetical protein
MYLPSATFIQNYICSYRKFSSGDYALLYNILSTLSGLGCMVITSVDSAVSCFNAAVQDAMEHGIPPWRRKR